MTLAESWNGTVWSVVASPNVSGSLDTELKGITCLPSGSCVAVGVSDDGTRFPSLVESWNGATWSIVSSPSPNPNDDYFLLGVTCLSLNSCLAVGAINIGSGSASKSLIESWNGATWSIVPSPNPTGSSEADLFGVYCASSGSCTAVGVSADAANGQALVESGSVPAIPNVTVTPSLNPAVSGPVSYSVAVTGGALGPLATGSVSVSDGQGGACSVTLVGGVGGCSMTETALYSPYQVTASYSGDGNYAAASGGITEAVNRAMAGVTLTPSSNPADGGLVDYAVQVTGTSSMPTGSVTISDGQGGTCSAPLVNGLSNCAITETALTSPLTISANYGGDANYSSSSASLGDC